MSSAIFESVLTVTVSVHIRGHKGRLKEQIIMTEKEATQIKYKKNLDKILQGQTGKKGLVIQVEKERKTGSKL